MDASPDVDQGRRRLLKAGGLFFVAATVSSAVLCTPTHTCAGDRLARPTDGQLEPTAASFFLRLEPVRSLASDLADVVNEVWVKEFGSGIDMSEIALDANCVASARSEDEQFLSMT